MSVLTDLRFAFRSLRKTPGVTIPAIVALAIGIGANSAIFSVIDNVLLRPLPFPQPERLVNLWETTPRRNLPRLPAPAGNYYDWRAQNAAFSAMGAYQPATFNLASTGEPERFLGAICDPGFFAALQVAPVLGRLFTEEENEPGRDGVVILGHGLWRARFGGDPKVIGQTLILNGRPRIVIGVMPDGFNYPPQAVMWSPLALKGEAKTRRDFHNLRVIARLKDGVSIDRARSDFKAVAARLDQAYPEFNKDEGISVNPMLEDAVGPIRPALLVLMCAVGFVLLIACSNVANLLLAKAAARRHEIAMRVSLGAGRAVIIGQMLAESVVLSGAGGLLGLGLAYYGFGALLSLAPANLPRLNEASLNGHAVVFTLALSLLTGLVFGLAPAWHAARTELTSLLKDSGRGSTSRNRVRDTLVVVQVAFTIVLLIGAGLLLRSFYEILHVDSGFRPDHVITMRLAPAPFKYAGHKDLQIQLARNILGKVSALPGVKSAAIASDLPLLGNPSYIMRFEGRPPVRVSEAPVTSYFAVSPGFFETMGMRLLRGRLLTDRDAAGTPLVTVVNQTLANLYFPDENPVGKRLEIGFSDPPNWREIVGVVADVHSTGLDQETPVQVFTALLQDPSFANLPSTMVVLARTAPAPESLATAMKSAILSVDRSQPVYAVQPMTDVVSQSLAQRRLSLVLLGFFAVAALLLASVGLYAVMSYAVTQRTPEIGVRMALGAQRSQVLLFMERQALQLVLIGTVIGVVAALALTRLMTSLLFHVPSNDLPTFALVPVILAVVGLAACYAPARRAARVDPMVALRHE